MRMSVADGCLIRAVREEERCQIMVYAGLKGHPLLPKITAFGGASAKNAGYGCVPRV